MDIIIDGKATNLNEIQNWVYDAISYSGKKSLSFTPSTVQGLIDKIEEQQRVIDGLETRALSIEPIIYISDPIDNRMAGVDVEEEIEHLDMQSEEDYWDEEYWGNQGEI